MADENKEQKAPEPKPKKASGLLEEAQRAYGIRPEHVLASKEYDDHVVIVTHGGSKVSFAPGDKVVRLSKIDLDGVPPAKPKE